MGIKPGSYSNGVALEKIGALSETCVVHWQADPDLICPEWDEMSVKRETRYLSSGESMYTPRLNVHDHVPSMNHNDPNLWNPNFWKMEDKKAKEIRKPRFGEEGARDLDKWLQDWELHAARNEISHPETLRRNFLKSMGDIAANGLQAENADYMQMSINQAMAILKKSFMTSFAQQSVDYDKVTFDGKDLVDCRNRKESAWRLKERKETLPKIDRNFVNQIIEGPGEGKLRFKMKLIEDGLEGT